MPHGDMTRRIEDALIDEDAAGRGEIVEKVTVHASGPAREQHECLRERHPDSPGDRYSDGYPSGGDAR